MNAEDVVRVDVAGRTLRLSNLTKVLYPLAGTTKAEVITYYTEVSAVILPLLAGRPVTRVRWPQGTSEPSFFEKNIPAGAPSWIDSMTVGGVRYLLVA